MPNLDNVVQMLNYEKQMREYPAGAVIFNQGEPGNAMFFVHQGRVDLDINGQFVDSVTENQMFGEMAMLEHEPRVATATASANCTVSPIDEKRFERMISMLPEFALEVLRLLAMRIKRANLLKNERSANRAEESQKYVFGLLRNSKDAKVYAPGTEIFTQGQPGHEMYIIQSGSVELRINGNTIASQTDGGIFGEMALLDTGVLRSATAVAATECRLILIDQRRFLFMIQNTPGFAIYLLRLMSHRLRVTDQRKFGI